MVETSSGGAQLLSCKCSTFRIKARESTYSHLSFSAMMAVLVLGLSKSLHALTGNVQPTDIRSLWRMGLGREQDYSIAMTQSWDSMGDCAFYGTALFANGL